MPAVRRLSRSARESLAGQKPTYRRVDSPPFVVREFGWSPENHIWSTVCTQEEEVEWHWCHTPAGSYVSGFTLKPRAP